MTTANPPHDYRRVVLDVYAAAARAPDATLCCVPGGALALPDLVVPPAMLEMNYGCGTAVHPADLRGERPIVYVGVGGGLEALQLAWFRRRPGGVIAIDPVAEMRAAATRNLRAAAERNAWFRPEFVEIRAGSAEALPVDDATAEVVAQNCLFNVFTRDDLEQALREVTRVLAEGGRFCSTDPVSTAPMPAALRDDASLRARCVSGCLQFAEVVDALCGAGLARIVVRGRRPYRLLTPAEFPVLAAPLLLESVELVAVKGAAPGLFTGRTAIHTGRGRLEVGGFPFVAGVPVPVSDETARALAARDDFHLTPPTWHAGDDGCC